jgi:hypothetical protein
MRDVAGPMSKHPGSSRRQVVMISACERKAPPLAIGSSGVWADLRCQQRMPEGTARYAILSA